MPSNLPTLRIKSSNRLGKEPHSFSFRLFELIVGSLSHLKGWCDVWNPRSHSYNYFHLAFNCDAWYDAVSCCCCSVVFISATKILFGLFHKKWRAAHFLLVLLRSEHLPLRCPVAHLYLLPLHVTIHWINDQYNFLVCN